MHIHARACGIQSPRRQKRFTRCAIVSPKLMAGMAVGACPLVAASICNAQCSGQLRPMLNALLAFFPVRELVNQAGLPSTGYLTAGSHSVTARLQDM